MYIPFYEFILEDKNLGRALDASQSMCDSPFGTNWSSPDPFGF
jgi:hypothetical protein